MTKQNKIKKKYKFEGGSLDGKELDIEFEDRITPVCLISDWGKAEYWKPRIRDGTMVLFKESKIFKDD